MRPELRSSHQLSATRGSYLKQLGALTRNSPRLHMADYFLYHNLEKGVKTKSVSTSRSNLHLWRDLANVESHRQFAAWNSESG